MDHTNTTKKASILSIRSFGILLALVVLSAMNLRTTLWGGVCELPVYFMGSDFDLPDSAPPHNYHHHQQPHYQQASRRPKIALVSSYIPSDMWRSHVRDEKVRIILDHQTNRACYCHQWNYDCILNQTNDLTTTAMSTSIITLSSVPRPSDITTSMNISSSSSPERWWLQWATWDRVTHIEAALAKYDWVLYGDLDYIIKDMTRPLESFLYELELHGKRNVSVIVPSDLNHDNVPKPFSVFAIMVKNSPFGWKLMENWRAFAMGICPNGNFFSADKNYEWFHSDQPGLWYALMKTHTDFYPNSVFPSGIIECNATSGFINNTENRGPWLGLGEYFTKNGLKAGNYGNDLDAVPDDQPIIFSKSGEDSMSGLGVDHNWVYTNNQETGAKLWKHAFALHQNQPSTEWDNPMQRQLDMCINIHGCFAKLVAEGEGRIEFGCNDTESLYLYE